MKLISLEKSLQTIDLLGKHPRGISLSELAEKLGYHKSTLHHILQTLLPYDYVSQDPESKRYLLGYKFLSMSKLILDNLDVRQIAQLYLQELHERCQEPVHLAILRNGKVIYIDKIDHPGGLSLATYIGFSTDPHAAAGGKVLLAALPSQEVMEIYASRPLRKYGKNTITSLNDLLQELDRIRRHGYAIDDEEYYEGVRCVAAPIRGGGKVVAALSITGSIFTMTMERIERELQRLVVQTAAQISAKMIW